jgi:hypothetical protein
VKGASGQQELEVEIPGQAGGEFVVIAVAVVIVVVVVGVGDVDAP